MNPEILGYVNMAIGLVGIVLTVLSAPTLLHLGAKVRTEALPAEFSGLAGTIRTLAVLLVLVTFMFLLGLGMAMTLAQVTTALGAAYPTLTAVMIVAFIFSAAATAVLAIYRHAMWVPGVVGTLGLATVAFTAALAVGNPGALATAFGLSLAVFLVTGVLTLVAMGHA